MNVEELLTLPSAVSWTDKPFTYYIHTIDRSLVSTFINSVSLYVMSPWVCDLHKALPFKNHLVHMTD